MVAKLDYFADAPLDRRQQLMFSPTLDSMIGADDPVRLVDEVLATLDWSEWEAEYHGRRGQPPIHPRILAAVLLYGLCRGLRSTRKLEEACCYRMDFMWLAEGRRIDHTTFARFRTRFGKPLKKLFRDVCRIAMTMGLVQLGEVAFDGTRVKAYNSRFNTRTAATLEEKLAALDAKFEQMLAELDAVERQEMLQGHGSPTSLPAPLADIEKRRNQVRAALEKAREMDEARRREGIDPQKNPAQVPTFDPDSRVMPNKEGGYAPNYTPTATTDGKRGFIVACEVLGDDNESTEVVPSIERIEENFGAQPEHFLADGGNASGALQQALEERGIEFYIPSPPPVENVAQRADPTQPVPEVDWDQLPRNNKKQLDKSAFVYDPRQDQYYCPQGEAMPFAESKPDVQQGQRVERRVYRAPAQACAACPLATWCVSPRSKRGRSITRDEFEEVRERTAQRMSTPQAKQIYDQRPRIAETPFGILKGVFGMRQFLLRGLSQVQTEWRWATTAFNLKKLVHEIGRLRADFTQTLIEMEN